MKTFPFVVLASVLLALDWVALHNIITGHESSYWLEYGMLAFSLFLFAGMTFLVVSRKLLGNRPS